jgi:hypothetical protein
MKARSMHVLFLLLAVLAAASAGPLSAEPAKAYRLGAVERYGVKAIRPNVSSRKVLAYLGQPDQKLSSDIWVYRKLPHRRNPAHEADCTTLLVHFSQNRVSDLQKVNETAVGLIAARFPSLITRRQMVAEK